MESKILKQFGCGKFIYCSDAGLASEDNRAFNHLGQRSFIVTQSIKKLPAEDREWALNMKGFKHLPDGAPVDLTSCQRRISTTAYRALWTEIMGKLEMQHTPHECRHTFETLLDAAGGNRRCIDLLMGHTSKDTGNRVYNHKTIEELRATVELISI